MFRWFTLGAYYNMDAVSNQPHATATNFAGEAVELDIALKPTHVGAVSLLGCLAVDGQKAAQGFRLRASVMGLNVTWQVLSLPSWRQQQESEAQRLHLQLRRHRSTARSSSTTGSVAHSNISSGSAASGAMTASPSSSNHRASSTNTMPAPVQLTEGCCGSCVALDFGAVQLNTSCSRVVAITNQSSIATDVSAWVVRFATAASAAPAAATAGACSGGGGAASGALGAGGALHASGATQGTAAVARAASASCRSLPPLQLQDPSLAGAAPFTAQAGNAMMAARATYSQIAAALGGAVRGLALAVRLEPAAGVLGPWGGAAVVVEALAGMVGEYVDELCIQVGVCSLAVGRWGSQENQAQMR